MAGDSNSLLVRSWTAFLAVKLPHFLQFGWLVVCNWFLVYFSSKLNFLVIICLIGATKGVRRRYTIIHFIGFFISCPILFLVYIQLLFSRIDLIDLSSCDTLERNAYRIRWGMILNNYGVFTIYLMKMDQIRIQMKCNFLKKETKMNNKRARNCILNHEYVR